MDQAERFKEFTEKYEALKKEYDMEIRPVMTLNVVDLAPKEEVVKEAEIVETPENEAL